MHGSRPDLFQLRQLFLAAVITAGAIAIIAGVALCSGTSGLSQSAATVIAIAKMSVGSPPTDFKFARTGQAGPGKWAAVRAADADNYYVVRANALEDVDTFMAAIHWENTDRLFSELTNERGAQPGDKPT
jgi:hypothetical protein